MGYGISSTSSNNTVQIDSDSPYSYFKTTAQSSGNTVTLSNPTDLLFIKPPSFPSSFTWGTNVSGGVYSIYADNAVTAADYVALRPSRISSATTGYGLQVFNVDGQLAFDSGVFISGTSGDKIATVVRVVDINGAYGNYSSIYTGSDYEQVYALVNGSYRTWPQVVLHSFRWNQATTSIQYASFLAAAPPVPGATFYNGSSIVLVKLI